MLSTSYGVSGCLYALILRLTNVERSRICVTFRNAKLNCEDVFASSNNVTVALLKTVGTIDAVTKLVLDRRSIPDHDDW